MVAMQGAPRVGLGRQAACRVGCLRRGVIPYCWSTEAHACCFVQLADLPPDAPKVFLAAG